MVLRTALGTISAFLCAFGCSTANNLGAAEFLATRPLVAEAQNIKLAPAPEGTPQAASLAAIGRADLIDRPNLEGVCNQALRGATGLPAVYNEIVRRAGNAQFVVVNEAHDIPEHRAFLEGLLSHLRKAGFAYLAMESISDGSLPEGKAIAALKHIRRLEQLGIYFGDPRLGRLAQTSRALGFSVIQYDFPVASSDQQNVRETLQADRFLAALEMLPEDTRVVIHAGHGHAAEKPFVVNEDHELNWFIAQVKERTGVDPLTVNLSNCGRGDQTVYTFAEPAFAELTAAFDLFVAMPAVEKRSLSTEAVEALGLQFHELSKEFLPNKRSLIVVSERNCRDCQPYDLLLYEPGADDEVFLLVPTTGGYRIDYLDLGHRH